MSDDIVTADCRKFGAREVGMAIKILNAHVDHKTSSNFDRDFYQEEVSIAFNRNSGCVFITNSEYQAGVMNGDTLDMWYNCPICGHEGFAEDMNHGKDEKECQEYLHDIGVIGDNEIQKD